MCLCIIFKTLIGVQYVYINKDSLVHRVFEMNQHFVVLISSIFRFVLKKLVALYETNKFNKCDTMYNDSCLSRTLSKSKSCINKL